MPDTNSRRAVVVAAALLVGPLLAAPVAHADEAFWGGRYKITFHTDQKSGTSVAASQQETAYTAGYVFETDCSSGTCVATATDGPTPKDNVPKAMRFDWTGSVWTRTNNWNWDCLLPDGTITFDPAKSVTTYTPQSDGSLKGTFDTTIADGACAGTVVIPLTAVPAPL
ncbi:hypothetical protein MCHIJ_37100 [Mycolicibacterium chitae]|uniref:Conserved exported protein of uncharacterized function n=1 Tax=Mycolicibacterium chitae TaxID=1792 RepID=A0A3S5EID2_MYCCI|nr:hypothetical protein [Mycolicibacterium chitae]MCV7107503.1 hypothetical protein [Mycolicibacterium chitae]BBZ04273.1 hypothetical protein MCHIJ_37100 [Mycolicibacterium chitae]VEG47914.1 Conserved exported protein of uncharacterised function [Mycolicibacterium chitae]